MWKMVSWLNALSGHCSPVDNVYCLNSVAILALIMMADISDPWSRNRPEIRLNPVPAGFPASNSGSGSGPVSNRFAGFQPEFDKIF